MEKAILKSIEGGWKFNNKKITELDFCKDEKPRLDYFFLMTDTHTYSVDYARVYSDPLFWQALGKAEGWKLENCDVEYGAKKGIYCSHCHFGANEDCNEWLYHWHYFIDHLASDGSVDKFFDDLLSGTAL